MEFADARSGRSAAACCIAADAPTVIQANLIFVQHNIVAQRTIILTKPRFGGFEKII